MFYKTTADGGRLPAEEGGFRSDYKYWSATEAQTLRVEDSGATISLSAGGGSAITLPSLQVGYKQRFVVGRAFITTDWVITIPSAVGNGGAMVNSTFVPAAGETTITLAAGNATVGDYLEIEVVNATVAGGLALMINGNFAQAAAVVFA